MTPQQLQEQPQLENRVAMLETELAQMKKLLTDLKIAAIAISNNATLLT